MGAARQTSQLDPQRAGTIRRVVRNGARHMCGLCRSPYEHSDEALNCVRHCWRELLMLPPVLLRRRILKRVFRCRFCARDHGEYDVALQCASDCKRRLQDRFNTELAAANLPELTPRRKMRAPKPVPVVVRFEAPRAKVAKAEVAEAPVAAMPVKADVVADTAPEAAPVKKKTQKENEMFYRDQANYVCHECKAKYFTRMEVVACYKAH